jgi:nucleoside-diphosphate-sugar epimerase
MGEEKNGRRDGAARRLKVRRADAPPTHDQGGSRVLVTGGSGFIGTALIERLREAGRQVISLDPAPPRNPEHHDVWRGGDLLDASATQELVGSFCPTHVVHLGARTDLRGKKLSDYAVNTEGTRNLLTAVAAVDPPPRLIAASTRMVCTIGYQPRSDTDYCPPNAYGESKVAMERIVRAAGYPETWCLVRPTSIWGPWFDVPYRDFFLAVAKGRYRHPAGAPILKSFGYVENTAHQILGLMQAGDASVNGRVFYLADYAPIEVLDWASRIQEATGAPAVKTVSRRTLRVVAAGGDVLGQLGWREPPLTSFRLANLVTNMVYDLEPLRALVPQLPVTLDHGINRTVAWLRAFGVLDGRVASPA